MWDRTIDKIGQKDNKGRYLLGWIIWRRKLSDRRATLRPCARGWGSCQCEPWRVGLVLPPCCQSFRSSLLNVLFWLSLRGGCQWDPACLQAPFWWSLSLPLSFYSPFRDCSTSWLGIFSFVPAYSCPDDFAGKGSNSWPCLDQNCWGSASTNPGGNRWSVRRLGW